jgi:hypothetical protein
MRPLVLGLAATLGEIRGVDQVTGLAAALYRIRPPFRWLPIVNLHL